MIRCIGVRSSIAITIAIGWWWRCRLEYIRSIAALPPGAVESDECGVDAHIRATLVDAVDVARTGFRDERYPARELPFHLDVEVWRLLQLVE